MIFFDLEATSPDPQSARIFEIGILQGDRTYHSWVNPEMAIPSEVVALCKLTPEKLDLIRHARLFAEVIDDILPLLDDPDWVAFGGLRFDIPLMSNEFERAGREMPWGGKNVIDVGNLYKLMNPRTLEVFSLQYNRRAHTESHGAVPDAAVLRDGLPTFLSSHDEIRGLSPSRLAKMSAYGKTPADPAGLLYVDDEGRVCFNTHRNRGVPILDEISYARWMANQQWVADSTRRIIRRVIDDATKRDESPGLFDKVEPDGTIPF